MNNSILLLSGFTELLGGVGYRTEYIAISLLYHYGVALEDTTRTADTHRPHRASERHIEIKMLIA